MHHHPEHVMYQQGHELYGQQQYVQHHNHTIQPEEYLYQQHQPTDIYQDHQQYQQNHIPYSPHEIIRTAPEDVLMMDIDDDTQLEAITNEISEWRTHFDYQLPMAGTEMEYMINSQSQLDYVHPTEWTFIIPDTNYFISHLNFLSKLIRTLNNIPKVILLVPTVVLKELDGLKSQSSLEWKARNAINLLYDAFRENVPCVRGQKLEEVLLEADERKMNNDDKILGCCRYFLQGTPRLLLLTDDKNLSVKAMVHSILSVSNYKQSVHHFMMDLAIHFQLQFPPAYIQIIQSEIENAAYNPPESKGRHAWETDGVIVEAKDDGVSLNPVLDPQAAPIRPPIYERENRDSHPVLRKPRTPTRGSLPGTTVMNQSSYSHDNWGGNDCPAASLLQSPRDSAMDEFDHEMVDAVESDLESQKVAEARRRVEKAAEQQIRKTKKDPLLLAVHPHALKLAQLLRSSDDPPKDLAFPPVSGGSRRGDEELVTVKRRMLATFATMQKMASEGRGILTKGEATLWWEDAEKFLMIWAKSEGFRVEKRDKKRVVFGGTSDEGRKELCVRLEEAFEVCRLGVETFASAI